MNLINFILTKYSKHHQISILKTFWTNNLMDLLKAGQANLNSGPHKLDLYELG